MLKSPITNSGNPRSTNVRRRVPFIRSEQFFQSLQAEKWNCSAKQDYCLLFVLHHRVYPLLRSGLSFQSLQAEKWNYSAKQDYCLLCVLHHRVYLLLRSGLSFQSLQAERWNCSAKQDYCLLFVLHHRVYLFLRSGQFLHPHLVSIGKYVQSRCGVIPVHNLGTLIILHMVQLNLCT